MFSLEAKQVYIISYMCMFLLSLSVLHSGLNMFAGGHSDLNL